MKHPSHTTRFLCLFLLLCFLLLTACNQGDGSTSSSSTEDTGLPHIGYWRDVYFRETHALNTSHPCVLYDVAVKKVFDGVYSHVVSDHSLLVECEVKHIFYQSSSYETRVPFAAEGDTVFLWVDVNGYEWKTDSSQDALDSLFDTVASLKTFLESIDSAIVYGFQTTPYIDRESPLCSRLKQELDEDSISYTDWGDGSQVLSMPSVKVLNLKSWPIIPILDGKFDANSIMSALGVDHMDRMAFSVAYEIPEGWQYFKDGDDVDTIYDALDRFVSEFEAL